VFTGRGAEPIRIPDAPAWHQSHYPDGCPAQIMQKRSYVPGEAYRHPNDDSFDGVFRYIPVERMNNGVAYSHPLPDNATPYRRDIRTERERLGFWT
jgi:hypothetical protein